MEQPGFTKLTVEGYRRLADVSIDFTGRPLAVIVGANGAGKTSLLKAFRLLAASANGKLKSFLSDEFGLADILTRDKARYLYLHAEVVIKDATFSYELDLTSKRVGYEIAEDLKRITDPGARELIHMRGTIVAYYDDPSKPSVFANLGYQPNLTETALSQVPRSITEIEEVREKLASSEYYSLLDVRSNSPIRLPQAVEPIALPLPSGDGTISALYNLRENDPDRFEVIEDTLRAVFPYFEALRFPSVAAGRVLLTWKEKGFDKPFYVNELSEGTLRFLWLCAILYSPELPEVVLIDEPEVSMHPTMLRMLAEVLKEASERSQIIIATQSDRLVSFLEPKHLLVADVNEEGMAEFSWADQKADLAHWLEDYSLGELWNMNVFGGRP